MRYVHLNCPKALCLDFGTSVLKAVARWKDSASHKFLQCFAVFWIFLNFRNFGLKFLSILSFTAGNTTLGTASNVKYVVAIWIYQSAIYHNGKL